MALEDFFTLIEMKEGITTIDRVEELVCAMQKENDASVHNINETARQWSTVANTLIATENTSIHKHFIQLGGLLILDQWLQTAQEYSLEEATCKLFEALEKLPVDHETPGFSSIIVIVKNLIEHKSLSVQEKAKALFDRLNQGMEKEPESVAIVEIPVLDDAVLTGVDSNTSTVVSNSSDMKTADKNDDQGTLETEVPRLDFADSVISPKPEEVAQESPTTRGFDLNEESVEGSSEKVGFFDIDLNKAEENNDHHGTGFPSGESSVEVSSRTPKKLNLDLNHSIDEAYRSPSPVSSFSGVKLNLDLNNKCESSQVISLFGAQLSLPSTTVTYFPPCQGPFIHGSGSGSAPIATYNMGSGYNWVIPTQEANMLEENMASSSQSSRSKRVEPEDGFDPYSGVYKRPWL